MIAKVEGLIDGLVTGRSPHHSVRFAVATSALKQSIPGTSIA